MSPRKRIGVMIPSTNTTCEADFQMAVPRDITVHGQRLWMTNEGTGDEAYVRMNAEIESGARYLATAHVDVVVYGCTTGSFYKAIEARTGKPAVSSNQSTIWTALRALGVTRPITGFGRLLEHLTPARPAPPGASHPESQPAGVIA